MRDGLVELALHPAGLAQPQQVRGVARRDARGLAIRLHRAGVVVVQLPGLAQRREDFIGLGMGLERAAEDLDGVCGVALRHMQPAEREQRRGRVGGFGRCGLIPFLGGDVVTARGLHVGQRDQGPGILGREAGGRFGLAEGGLQIARRRAHPRRTQQRGHVLRRQLDRLRERIGGLGQLAEDEVRLPAFGPQPIVVALHGGGPAKELHRRAGITIVHQRAGQFGVVLGAGRLELGGLLIMRQRRGAVTLPFGEAIVPRGHIGLEGDGALQHEGRIVRVAEGVQGFGQVKVADGGLRVGGHRAFERDRRAALVVGGRERQSHFHVRHLRLSIVLERGLQRLARLLRLTGLAQGLAQRAEVIGHRRGRSLRHRLEQLLRVLRLAEHRFRAPEPVADGVRVGPERGGLLQRRRQPRMQLRLTDDFHAGARFGLAPLGHQRQRLSEGQMGGGLTGPQFRPASERLRRGLGLLGIEEDVPGALLHLGGLGADGDSGAHQRGRIAHVAELRQHFSRGGDVAAFAGVEPRGLAIQPKRFVGVALRLAYPPEQIARFGVAGRMGDGAVEIQLGLFEFAQFERGPRRLASGGGVLRILLGGLLQCRERVAVLPHPQQRHPQLRQRDLVARVHHHRALPQRHGGGQPVHPPECLAGLAQIVGAGRVKLAGADEGGVRGVVALRPQRRLAKGGVRLRCARRELRRLRERLVSDLVLAEFHEGLAGGDVHLGRVGRDGQRVTEHAAGLLDAVEGEQGARVIQLQLGVARVEADGLLPRLRGATQLAEVAIGLRQHRVQLHVVRVEFERGLGGARRIRPQLVARVRLGEGEVHSRVIGRVLQGLLQGGHGDVGAVELQTHLPEAERPIGAGGLEVQRALIADEGEVRLAGK